MTLEVRLNELLPSLDRSLAADAQWLSILRDAPGVHLAVLVEPFLSYILQQRKTIESRFSMNRIAPFMRVVPGDLIVLKQSAGPVVGLVRVERPEFFVLNGDSWPKVKAFADSICADESFWCLRAEKRYATLLHLGPVRQFSVSVNKADRRPWVVLRDPHVKTLSLCV